MTAAARRAVRQGGPRAGLLLASVALLAAACGSNGTTTSVPSVPTHAASPASSSTVDCGAVNSLRGSLESLSHTSVSPTSAGAITSDLKNIEAQVAKLKGQAGGELSGQVNELSKSVDQIKKASNELSTNPTSAIEQLTKALTGLKGKVGPLVSKMNALCPK